MAAGKTVGRSKESKFRLAHIPISTQSNERMKKEETYSETELNRTQGDDENTSDDGDGAVPNHLRRPHHTRLPRPHSVPASSVKKWLPQIPPILVLVPETHP